jgi:hypothetical protein
VDVLVAAAAGHQGLAPPHGHEVHPCGFLASDSPSWFGDWKVTTDQPNARERRWRLLMNSASRIRE